MILSKHYYERINTTNYDCSIFKKKVGLINFLIVLFFLLGQTACSFKENKNEPSTLLMYLSSDPITLNPVLAEDAYSNSIANKIFEGLIKRDPKTFKFVGNLAKSWEISQDLMEIDFWLRNDVKFHDGKPFSAKDVLFTFNKIMDESTPNPFTKVYFQDVKSLTALNEYHIKFRMKKPYFKSLEFVGGFSILPKHIYGKLKNFVTNEVNLRGPVGTGPYVFKEWKTGQYLILENNEFYYEKKPEIKKILYRIVKNETVQLQMLKKQELDLLSLKPFQWVRQTNSHNFSRNYKKIKYPGTGFRYIGYNTRRFPFKSKEARKAMAHLMDLEKIKRSLLENLASIVTGPFWIAAKQYNHSLKPLAYDPGKAISLLKSIGYKEGSQGGLEKNGKRFSFELQVPAGIPFYEQFTSLLKENLEKTGIEMEIRKLEFSVLVDNINRRDFQAVMLGWSTGFESDPYQLWHSSQVKKGHNFVGFTTPEMDHIIEAARVEFNEKRRNKLYHRFHEILYENQPYTFLFTQDSLVAVHRRFQNVQVYKSGLETNEWKVPMKTAY